MKITEYVKYDQHRTFLYEGLNPQTINETREWERILKPIVEAQLTPDQINQLFTQAQQVATAGGANRTLAGKGVDTAKAAGEAFEKVKAAMQNTGPIQGFEAQYDKIAAKLKEKTGGDQGVMQYIQKYRDFASKHPVAQKVIYAAAIAALGALAVGGSIAAVSGGPVVLGLFKMTDRLLQGDKLTSAAWQGVKTGAGAAAAVGLGKTIRGALGLGTPTSTSLNSKIVNRPDDFGPTGTAQPQGGGKIAGAASDAATNLTPGQMASKGLQQLKDMVAKGEITDYNSYQKALRTVTNSVGASGLSKSIVEKQIDLLAGNEAAQASGGKIGGGSANIIKKFIEINGGTPDEQSFAAGEKVRQQMIAQMQGDEKAFAAKGAAPQSTGSTGAAQPQANPAAEPELKGSAAAAKRAADMKAAADKIAGDAGGGTAPTIAQGSDILNPPAEIQGNKQLSAAYKELVAKIQSNPDYNVRNLPGDIQRFASQNSAGGLQATRDASTLSLIVQKAGGGDMKGFVNAVKVGTGVMRGATANPANFEESLHARLRENLNSRQTLPKSQIQEMFRLADEGAWDAFKKGASAVGGAVASGAKAVAGSKIGQAVGATAKDAASAVAQKVGTAATNITTKVTSDKLMKAWKTAGSPTDSAEVYKIMKAQGLDDAMLADIFKAAKIPLPPTQGAGFNVKLPQKPVVAPATQPTTATPSPATQPAASAAPGQQKDDWKARRDAQWKKKQDAAKGIHHITKPGSKINEEPDADVPLNKAAINKILMSVAQAGAGGGSPQQQASSDNQQASGGGQQSVSQNTSARTSSRNQQATQQSDEVPQVSASGTSTAPAQNGLDVPLNKAAINKILMSVAQASS